MTTTAARTDEEARQDRRMRDGETRAAYWDRIKEPTGRKLWMDASPSAGAFESSEMDETLWHAGAVIGEQSGTYFRTSKTTESGAIVWRWGGVDPDDRAAGYYAR